MFDSIKGKLSSFKEDTTNKALEASINTVIGMLGWDSLLEDLAKNGITISDVFKAMKDPSKGAELMEKVAYLTKPSVVKMLEYLSTTYATKHACLLIKPSINQLGEASVELMVVAPNEQGILYPVDSIPYTDLPKFIFQNFLIPPKPESDEQITQ